MQASFISAGLLVSAILAIITYFQLDWLRDQMLSETEDLLEDNVNQHMYEFAEDLSILLSTNTQQLAGFLLSMSELVAYIHGLRSDGESPLVGGEPLMHNSIPYNDLVYSEEHGMSVTFKSGVFYSPNDEISETGTEIMSIGSALDSLSPDLYYVPTLNFYTGYTTDELFHLYPGRKIDSDYTPIVREWFYKAAENPGEIVITEPYLEKQSNVWMISFSKAILYEDGIDVFAVVAIDVSIDIVSDEMNSVPVMSDGFLVYLSNTGIVINQPDQWTSTSSIMRIYESPNVDIDYDQWLEINDTTIAEDTLMTFRDDNSTVYYFTRSFVYPFEDRDYTSIIMVCVEKDEALKEKDELEDDYTKTFEGIFYFVIAVAIVCFLSIATITFLISKRLKTQLEGIDRVLHRIVANASKTNLVDGINPHKIEKYRKDIEDLADACSKRLEIIGDEENTYRSVEWGTSRPAEVMQFEVWRKCLHPSNIYYKKDMPWKHLIKRIAKKVEGDAYSKYFDEEES